MTTTPTDHSELRRKAEAARDDSPTPWRVKLRARAQYGNVPSELVDAGDAWVASFDGHHEQEFAAAANPSVVIALLDQLEAYRDALEFYGQPVWSVGGEFPEPSPLSPYRPDCGDTARQALSPNPSPDRAEK